MNVNDAVWVRLTNLGEKIWTDHWNGTSKLFGEHGVPMAVRNSHCNAVGQTRFLLWELMSIFGPHIYHSSGSQVFKDNKIETCLERELEEVGFEIDERSVGLDNGTYQGVWDFPKYEYPTLYDLIKEQHGR